MHRFIVAILLLAAPHGAFASPGALFAEPDFFPLGLGIGLGFTDGTGVLGDVDGDGDLDLVVGWNRWSVYAEDRNSEEHLTHWGWTVASNDGLGGLVSTRDVMHGKSEPGTSWAPIVSLWGDDFDGDGLLDLAFEEGLDLELWHNRGEDGFATVLQLPNVVFIGLADGEGDGDLDLLVMEYEEYEDESQHSHDGTSQATLWFNDGDAEFVRSDRFTLDSEAGFWPRLWPAEQSLGAIVLGRSGDGDPLDLDILGGAFVFINQGSPPTAVAVESATPSAFVLGANYPNPFNPATTIPLSVPDGAATVDVAIYNLLGQLVRQVSAGEHRLTWDGRDELGQLVASGAYLYQLRVGDQLRTHKMVKLE